MVVHKWRHGKVGDPQFACLAEQIEVVLLDGDSEGRALVLPVGDQRVEPARIEDRAGQDMRSDLGAFFQHHDVQIGIQLLEADRCRQARRACAHDDHVILHRLALRIGHVESSPPGGYLRNNVTQ